MTIPQHVQPADLQAKLFIAIFLGLTIMGALLFGPGPSGGAEAQPTVKELRQEASHERRTLVRAKMLTPSPSERDTMSESDADNLAIQIDSKLDAAVDMAPADRIPPIH